MRTTLCCTKNLRCYRYEIVNDHGGAPATQAEIADRTVEGRLADSSDNPASALWIPRGDKDVESPGNSLVTTTELCLRGLAAFSIFISRCGQPAPALCRPRSLSIGMHGFGSQGRSHCSMGHSLSLRLEYPDQYSCAPCRLRNWQTTLPERKLSECAS